MGWPRAPASAPAPPSFAAPTPAAIAAPPAPVITATARAANAPRKASGAPRAAPRAAPRPGIAKQEPRTKAPPKSKAARPRVLVPVPPPPPTAKMTKSGRGSKRAVRIDETGMFDVPAGAYRTVPPGKKRRTSLQDEMHVPEWCKPGVALVADGFHANTTKKFDAIVVAIRPKWPPIHVKYVRNREIDSTHTLALPMPSEAYVDARAMHRE